MKFFNHALCIAALSTIAAISYAGSAQAISFRITPGVAGPNGETDQGAFSEYQKLKGTTTINFNDGKAPTTGFAKYSFENGGSYVSSGAANPWAPAGAGGERNNSNYLAVFHGSKVTISLEKTLNYFGIDWGAVSANNTFSFFKSGKEVKTFTTADILDNKALFRASWQNGEGNGYVHFYSDSDQDNFDQIVISQSSTAGGGFESDNHSFHVGTGKFDPKPVPEPSILLGMLAAGSTFLLKRRNQKQA